jgi:ATP-binding cassette subfamily F protein uup
MRFNPGKVFQIFYREEVHKARLITYFTVQCGFGLNSAPAACGRGAKIKNSYICRMHYLSAEGLGKSYGVKPLFTDLSFHIEEGDKIAFVARNGAGKSTLLKILAGRETPDEGKLWIHKDVNVAYLEQESVSDEQQTVLDNIFTHPHPLLQLVRRYEALSLAPHPDQHALTALAGEMDAAGAWQFEGKVKEIIGRLHIGDAHRRMQELSGGQRKRVALAKTLIDAGFDSAHTLLLMDEPTNHLDMDMIEWLEQYLSREKVTLLVITHDRYFLDRVCNEILELENGRLYPHRGNYAFFLEKKYAREQSQQASLEKSRNLLRRELEWMRRQPRARTTKSRSRIDAFYELKEKASGAAPEARLDLEVKMTRLGGKILELKKVYKSFGEQPILRGLDYTFKKGERVGVIGKNGVGKSTFLNIIQEIEKPDSGKVNVGDTVRFGYYRQQGLDTGEDKRVIEWVKDIAENFPLAGGGVVSASEFLSRFLFPPELQYTPISRLSGGEKRRLHLLSVLFRNPNFLILDEPTNDLDIQTLQVLEDFLEAFPGCVIIVSHDRYFMDRLVDHLLVFDGEGRIRDFPGNYSSYREAEEEEEKKSRRTTAADRQKPPPAAAAPAADKKKLSYREKRELEELDEEIPRLEAEKAALEKLMGEGSIDYESLRTHAERIGEISALLSEKELRWLVLDEKREG